MMGIIFEYRYLIIPLSITKEPAPIIGFPLERDVCFWRSVLTHAFNEPSSFITYIVSTSEPVEYGRPSRYTKPFLIVRLWVVFNS